MEITENANAVVIDLTDDTPVVVREGVGDVKPFL